MESINPKLEANFIFPDIESEIGEIERVTLRYTGEYKSKFMEEFIEKAKASSLVVLSHDIWSKLENTDSYDIPKGGWDDIEGHVSFINNETGASRDWKKIKNMILAGSNIDAPIILKYEGTYHKVSGNTRLMVARALGIQPRVLLVDMDKENINNE